ncbi:protein kinase domain-containing protein [Streptomyces sp. DH41]|uniref:protein kinase domain-containing protein n=1 Tax=Streptomyces sp. DH41 TaxID=3040125 RepID=UPI0024419A76|nr:protein kinase [Streptomyces sp. DH41]MDG9723958.1 protein kinase [Streptomyces sp. DH41]
MHHIGPDAAPDRYRLLNAIGRGGEAVLYRATIQLDGEPETVVVKVLDAKNTLTPDQFERLSTKWNDQAELLRFVGRPGVVGVREHFEGPPIHSPGEAASAAGRALVLVMNHVDGLDLRDWRAERTLDTHAERREVGRVLEQLADTLDWLHSGRATPSGRTVIHGDLSPGNIMVDVHGQATLVDFGLSKLTADHQTAEVWFTPGYAAPEVFDGKRTPNTDRYAFGAITYFLLSGQTPPTTPEQLRTALAELPSVRALAPDRAERVLTICATDPAQRPESLRTWLSDVRDAVVSTTNPVRDAVPTGFGGTQQPPTTVTAAPTAPPPRPAQAPPTTVTGSAAPGPAGTQAPPTTVTGSAAPGSAGGTYGTGGPEHPVPLGAFGPPVPPPTVAGAASGGAPGRPARGDKARRVLVPVLAVALVASLAVIGVQALADDGTENGASPAVTRTVTETATVTAPPDTQESPVADDGATAEPSGEESSADTGNDGVADQASSVSLTTFETVAQVPNASLAVGDGTMNNRRYETALVPKGGNKECRGWAEYNLGREWKNLTMTAGVSDVSANTSSRVEVSVDGQSLFTGQVDLGKPRELKMEVENGLRLRIAYSDPDSSCDMGDLLLADPTLTR